MSVGESFEIIQDFIPVGRSNRPGYVMNPRYITVHETGNTTVGANAERHAAYVKATGRLVSWHFTVDQGRTIYQHLPLNETGYHAGDGNGQGNRNSIGIELCVNRDGNFSQTRVNAAKLIAHLMETHNIPLANVRTHHSWSKKQCPANLLNDWPRFLQQISEADELDFEQPHVPDRPEVPDQDDPPDGQRRVLRLQTPYMRGEDVRELQSALVRNNFYPDRHGPNGGVDGVFGPKTENAVRRYQIMNGLKVDGVAGAETFASLGLSDAVGDDQPDGGGSETPRVLRLQTPYMRGEDVRELQSALVRNNFYPDRHGPNGGVDGVFGPKTEDAVRRYQMMNGLKVDGIAGPATLVSLNLTSANDRKEDEVRQPRRVLRLQTPYMRGEDVRELQSALVKSHFYPDRSAASYGIDGIYGPKTSGAVRRYQIMHGLKVDGIAGPETFKSLRL